MTQITFVDEKNVTHTFNAELLKRSDLSVPDLEVVLKYYQYLRRQRDVVKSEQHQLRDSTNERRIVNMMCSQMPHLKILFQRGEISMDSIRAGYLETALLMKNLVDSDPQSKQPFRFRKYEDIVTELTSKANRSRFKK